MHSRRLRIAAATLVIAVVGVVLLLLGSRDPDVAAAPLDALFIGDSYTAGVGASSDATRWTTLVATGMGWREDNRGLGGTGYVSTAGAKGCGQEYCGNYVQVAEEISGDEPDVIVVGGGQNDFDDWAEDPVQVTRAIGATYETLRSDHPTATIIAVGPSHLDRVDPTSLALDRAVRDAATSADARYVSLLEPLTIQRGMVLPDGGHVGDAGHRAIADRVLQTLQD